jgi:hypothetical protein
LQAVQVSTAPDRQAVAAVALVQWAQQQSVVLVEMAALEQPARLQVRALLAQAVAVAVEQPQQELQAVAVELVAQSTQQAQQEQQTQAAVVVVVLQLPAATAAAVLSSCALRVPTLPLTVQLHLVEHERERTQVAAPHTTILLSIRRAH